MWGVILGGTFAECARDNSSVYRDYRNAGSICRRTLIILVVRYRRHLIPGGETWYADETLTFTATESITNLAILLLGHPALIIPFGVKAEAARKRSFKPAYYGLRFAFVFRLHACLPARLPTPAARRSIFRRRTETDHDGYLLLCNHTRTLAWWDVARKMLVVMNF